MMEQDYEQNEETVEMIRSLLSSRAWREFFIPAMQATREASIKALLDPSEERQKDHPDADLRAQVRLLDDFLNQPLAILQEWDANRFFAEQMAEREKEEQERAVLGHVGPL
jgi:hypothetical protein